MTRYLNGFAIAALVYLSCAFPAAAQRDPVVDMQKIDCRAMLKMAHDEQDYTLLYFHGYMSGTKGDKIFDGPAFRGATEKIMDYCIDNPTSSLMSAFQKFR